MNKINMVRINFIRRLEPFIIASLIIIILNSSSIAQQQKEKSKLSTTTPQEKITAMQQWQKENYACMVDFGNNILNSIAPQGILFICGDAPTFALYHLLKEKKLRPDIEVYDYDGTFFKAPVDTKLVDDYTARKKAESDIIHNTKRPIYYIVTRDMQDLSDCKIKPCGLVYQILRPNEIPPDYKSILSKMNDLTDHLWKTPTFATREMVSNYLYVIGQTYYELGDTAKYGELIRRSAQIGFDVRHANSNAANNYVYGAGKENSEEAIYYYLTEIQGQPKDQLIYMWLSFAYDKYGEKDKAVAVYRKAIEIDPANPKAHFCFAQYLVQLGKDTDAIQEYQNGIALDSTDGEAYYRLGLLFEKRLNYPEATNNYKKSIIYLKNNNSKTDANTRLQRLTDKK
ncbi:MAG: tetratricopeptide repeat protein [bacterium]